MKMKNNVFLGCVILLIFGGLSGCSNGSTDTPGVYDGIGVWLVTGENAAIWKGNNYDGQPTPTAIGFLDGTLSALSGTFSVNLLVPHDFDPSAGGGWAAKYPPDDWSPGAGNYHVLLVPMWWPSGVRNQGNFTWMFDEGKVSAADGNLTTLNITSENPTLNRADFQNWGDVSP
jgi:hypothetical protein